MSNVTLFEGSANLPAHLRQDDLDEVTKRLLGNKLGGLRISFKGGVWRMMNNGEQVMVNEERAMNVIIVNAAEHTARTYYASAYSEDEPAKPPTCWSSNGVVPEAEVKERQAASCATCPKNVKGSGGRGDSRACRYSKNLAVTLENDKQGQVFKLTLPATSIFGKVENNVMPLDAYVKMLASQRIPITGVVTQMKFDPASATPKIGFKPVGYLSKEEYTVAKEKGQSPEAIEACKSTPYAADYGSNGPTAATRSTVADSAPSEDQAAVMAEMQKKLAASKAQGDSGTPVVMAPKGKAAPPPTSSAELLSKWESE